MFGIMAADNKSAIVTIVKGKQKKERKSMIFCNLKIVFSGLISEVEGKLNGSKLYKGRNNFIMSNKVKPKNPNTFTQASVRAGLRQYAATWQTLTQLQIKTWNEAGSTSSVKNKLGTSHDLSGFNLFVAENQRQQLATPGGAIVTTPPTHTGDIVPLNAQNLVMVGGVTPSVLLDIPAIPAGQVMVIYATSCLSPGKSFVKGKYRPIATIAAHAAQPGFDLTSSYEAVFGSPVTGQKAFFKWETMSTTGSKLNKFFGAESNAIIVG